MTALKEGQRVRIVAEGTVVTEYGNDTNGDCLKIETEHGYFYVETGRVLEPFVEIIPDPLPTDDGWYEAEKYPIDGEFPGVAPYERRGGAWYLGGNPLDEQMMRTVGTLYRLGRVS